MTRCGHQPRRIYLYRVIHNLTEDGAVQKQGKGYSRLSPPSYAAFSILSMIASAYSDVPTARRVVAVGFKS